MSSCSARMGKGSFPSHHNQEKQNKQQQQKKKNKHEWYEQNRGTSVIAEIILWTVQQVMCLRLKEVQSLSAISITQHIHAYLMCVYFLHCLCSSCNVAFNSTCAVRQNFVAIMTTLIILPSSKKCLVMRHPWSTAWYYNFL